LTSACCCACCASSWRSRSSNSAASSASQARVRGSQGQGPSGAGFNNINSGGARGGAVEAGRSPGAWQCSPAWRCPQVQGNATDIEKGGRGGRRHSETGARAQREGRALPTWRHTSLDTRHLSLQRAQRLAKHQPPRAGSALAQLVRVTQAHVPPRAAVALDYGRGTGATGFARLF
jgi:hypothetical protein